jgi:hypothetical protein
MDPNGEEYFEDADDDSSLDDEAEVVAVVEKPDTVFEFQILPDAKIFQQ